GPPENLGGYLSPAAAGMPPISSSSPARLRAAAPCATPWNAIGSAIGQPTFFTGFRAFIAPWNTMATSFHRYGWTESSPPARMFWPLIRTSPEADELGGSSPMSARIVVVFPQPDSPTRPNRSPA